MNNTVTIDWFAVTVKPPKSLPISAVEWVIKNFLLMDMKQFSFFNYGLNRYNRHYECGDIKIYYSQNERTGELSSKMGIFVQMTGEGCRQYEEYMFKNDNNWVGLFERFRKDKANFTRVDIANDIYDNVLDVQLIYEYCRKGLCISNSKTFEYYETGVLESGKIVGETVNIGKKGGDGQQLGIYNKKMEKEIKNNVKLAIETWVRCELRLFGEKANAFAKMYGGEIPLSELFFRLINQSYKFVIDSKYSNDTNKRRRPTVSWWLDYLNTSKKTCLEVKRKKITLNKTEKFLNKQTARSFALIYQAKCEAFGDDVANQFIIDLLSEGKKRLSDSDEKLIKQYAQEKRNSDYWGQETE